MIVMGPEVGQVVKLIKEEGARQLLSPPAGLVAEVVRVGEGDRGDPFHLCVEPLKQLRLLQGLVRGHKDVAGASARLRCHCEADSCASCCPFKDGCSCFQSSFFLCLLDHLFGHSVLKLEREMRER